MTRRIKKIIFEPKKKPPEKQVISIRFTDKIKKLLKDRANIDYSGRGKISSLVNDALRYYLFCAESINWGMYEKDADYIELLDDINEGVNQKDLIEPTKIFVEQAVYESLVKLENRLRLTEPNLRDVRAGLIRKAVSIRLSIESKAFFDNVMRNA
jgi:hypothetical protein